MIFCHIALTTSILCCDTISTAKSWSIVCAYSEDHCIAEINQSINYLPSDIATSRSFTCFNYTLVMIS